MTAYAALILHPSQRWLRIHRKQIESLLQKVRFLQEFLEDYAHRGHQEMAGLESQIAAAAYAAEDILESHVLDQILARATGSEAKSSTSFSEYIEKLIEEMEDLIETKVTRIKEAGYWELWGRKDRRFVDFSPAVSSSLVPNDQNILVGFDEKLIEIMDRLTGQQSNRQIIAIAGMGGIVPEGSGFSIGELTRLWVAEGFLKPIRAKSLEEVVYEYITDLIDRILIFVRRRGALGRFKTCGMHDLLRDLCLKEAQKENFLFVIDERNPDIPPEIEFKRRLCFLGAPNRYSTQVLDLLGPTSLTRPVAGVFGRTISLTSNMRLLRVLDVLVEEFPPNYAVGKPTVNVCHG